MKIKPTSKTGTIRVNGHPVSYIEYGGKNKPPLILIHGFHACAKNMEIMSLYFSKYFHVYAPDLPGFGNSPQSSVPFSIRSAGITMNSFMKTLGIRRYSLAGFSLGGAVCLEMAIDSPENVNNLVLVYPLAFGSDIRFTPAKRIAVNTLLTLATNPLTDSLAKKIFEDDRTMYRLFKILSASSGSTHEELVARIANAHLCRFETYVNGVKSIFNYQPSEEKSFPGIKTILILNKSDELINPKSTLEMLRKFFPVLKLYYLNISGHNPNKPSSREIINRQLPKLGRMIERDFGFN